MLRLSDISQLVRIHIDDDAVTTKLVNKNSIDKLVTKKQPDADVLLTVCVDDVGHDNEVSSRPAGLVLRWVIVVQPPKPTQPVDHHSVSQCSDYWNWLTKAC